MRSKGVIRVSRLGRADGRPTNAKPPTRLGLRALAQSLLCSFGLVSSACIVPPPLDVGEEEAGPSAPPVVVDVAPPEFQTPGLPIQVSVGDERLMTLTVDDIDVEDGVFVRFFVDYNSPDQLGPKAECSAAATGEVARQVDCVMETLCNGVTVDEPHFLEAVIADREFLETSDPRAEGQAPFRALPEGAASSVTSWVLECVEGDHG